jgi:hypothetical protein
MRVKDLIVKCNEVRLALGMKPIATWKGSKASLIEKIAELKGRLPKAITIGQTIMEALLETDGETGQGHPYNEILRRVKIAFPDSKTSVKCVRWYAKEMRKRGVLIPRRPRSKQEVKDAR